MKSSACRGGANCVKLLHPFKESKIAVLSWIEECGLTVIFPLILNLCNYEI